MFRIEDHPGYVSPARLNPEVPVTLDGVYVVCPRCQTVCKTSFDAAGQIEWWADRAKGHCVHFKGFYSSGSFRTVQAKFS